MTAESDTAAPVLHLAGVAQRSSGEVAELDRDEARHVRALRLAPGDAVRLTDGRGVLWGGELTSERTVRLGMRLPTPKPLDVELWVGIGNKSATLWLVEKAAEFGLRRLRPVECERSVSVADAGRSTAFWDKARRRALSAVKQSGSAWSPEILSPEGLTVALGNAGREAGRRLVMDPGGAPMLDVLAGWSGSSPCLVLVGPEGGLTDGELEACRAADFRPAALSRTILRFETAAVAALAIASQVAAASELPARTGHEGTSNQED